MKRLAVALLLGFAALPGAVRADETAGCGLASGPLLAQPEGSVLIGCAGGITEAFGGQLADILTRVVQNRLDPQVVIAKLEEMQGGSGGGARTVSDGQRQAIVQALAGKQAEQIAITVHPLVDDSAEYGKSLAAPLIMVGWQIEGNQIRRAAPKSLEGIAGVAIVVRSGDSLPPKAQQLKTALTAANIGAQLVSDPGLAADGAMLWIGRRPVFMKQ